MREYLILVLFWGIFGGLHSLLASDYVKGKIGNLMGAYQKYYRILYSLFAILSLSGVLWMHFQIPDQRIWSRNQLLLLIGSVSGFTGLSIVLVCVRKYFFDLSGIDIFFKISAKDELQVGGLNKYVRHPLYAGTLLFVWSLFIMFPSVKNLISACCISVYTVAGTILEEKKLTKKFGNVYTSYAAGVAMLIPGVF